MPQALFPAVARPPPPQRQHQDMETERPLDLSGPQARRSSEQPSQEKKSRFLSKKAVAILQHWYQKHRDHPYATDDEVKELALAGGIAPNQVNILCIIIGIIAVQKLKGAMYFIDYYYDKTHGKYECCF